jgi:polyribonucleotide nucleotidyltransferase
MGIKNEGRGFEWIIFKHGDRLAKERGEATLSERRLRKSSAYKYFQILYLTMTTNLDPQIFQRLHPKAYLERFIAEHVRPDGREASDWRDLFVHVGPIETADGSALVRLGDTTIVCGVKAEITEPDLERPTEGFLGSHLLIVVGE